jgi:hypothetical protein
MLCRDTLSITFKLVIVHLVCCLYYVWYVILPGKVDAYNYMMTTII